MFPDFLTQFFHILVFQVMKQSLVFAALAEIKERSGKFDLHSSVKQLGNRIVRLKMVIGSRNVMQTIQANVLLLLYQFIATSHTQPWEKKFGQIKENRGVHDSYSID